MQMRSIKAQGLVKSLPSAKLRAHISHGWPYWLRVSISRMGTGRRAYSPHRGGIKAQWTFCSAFHSHPGSGLSELSSRHPEMLC